ncbi:MAG: hypothetical protein V3S26_07385 [Acidimicrobiia bacterium]
MHGHRFEKVVGDLLDDLFGIADPPDLTLKLAEVPIDHGVLGQPDQQRLQTGPGGVEFSDTQQPSNRVQGGGEMGLQMSVHPTSDFKDRGI